MSEEEYFKFKILWNLVHSRPRRWGASHTPIKNVAGGLPGDKIGACLEVAEELLKERVLLPHKNGKNVSLNPKRIKEIMEFLEGFNE